MFNLMVWIVLLTATGPANKLLLEGTIPANKLLLAGTVPFNKLLLAGTLRVNNFLLARTPKKYNNFFKSPPPLVRPQKCQSFVQMLRGTLFPEGNQLSVISPL